MAQSSLRSRRILAIVLLAFAIVLAVVPYLLVGTHALVAAAAPVIILAVISVLLLAGWPRQTKQ